MNDLRLAIRFLVKNRGSSLAAVLSLAVAIGANTAIFSLVNDFLLRPLAVRNPNELILLRNIDGPGGRLSRAGENNGSIDPVTGRAASTSFSLLGFERMRAAHAPLVELFAYAPFSQVNILVDGVPETAATAQMVSGNYYTGLGVPAALGRPLTMNDDKVSAEPVAVISYRYWERRFQRHPDVLGKTIAINRVPTLVIGVAAEGFDGALQAGESPDVTVPLAHYLRFQPDRTGRAQPYYWWLRVMGRLEPGATAAQAAAALEPAFQQSAQEGWITGRATNSADQPPSVPTLAADPGSRGESDLRRQYGTSLRMLMGLAALLLLAACANVANLLIARAASRRREIRVRLALGATGARIVRQLLIESLLLALAAGALGVALAWSGRDLLLALRPFGNTTVILDLPIDSRVLAFTSAITLGTSLLFGLSPALGAVRVDLTPARQSGTRVTGDGRSRLSRAVAVVQIALSLMLLISTGLFVRTLNNLQNVDAGFNRRGLVLFRIDAASAGYASSQFRALQARVQQRLQALPGVHGVTFSSTALLSRVRQNRRIVVPEQMAPSGPLPIVNTNGVASNFFQVMELPVILGREFTEHDDAAAPKVAIVNRAFVRAYFGGLSPVGKFVTIPNYAERITVIGVCGDAKYTELRSDLTPTMYLPASQQVDGNANFAVRFDDRQATKSFPSIRSAVREIDPALPVLNLRTQDEQIDRLNGQERLFAKLSGTFGVVAMMLACIGLYGVMSHAVIRRTAEIGVRIALGATAGDVLRMILRDSLRLVTLGIAIGVAGALSASHVVASMLFGLSPTDRVTYGSAAGVLATVALMSSIAPALRASRIDPVSALKSE